VTAQAPDDDRPISPHPNFVTAEGMALIELELARAQERQDAAEHAGELGAIVRASREVRYWAARRATAQVADPPADAGAVGFGSTVTLAEAGAALRTLRIVGEDEAEAVMDALSYVSPLAQALLGRKLGETVEAEGKTLTVVAIG
jgi:transcription elongation GreA/GreB family factor